MAAFLLFIINQTIFAVTVFHEKRSPLSRVPKLCSIVFFNIRTLLLDIFSHLFLGGFVAVFAQCKRQAASRANETWRSKFIRYRYSVSSRVLMTLFLHQYFCIV